MSAFVLTPFQVAHVTQHHHQLRMGPRYNRYNPAFRRFKPRPTTPPNGSNGASQPPPPPPQSNGTPIANGAPAEPLLVENTSESTLLDSPPPDSPTASRDDRPDRDPDSSDTPTLIYDKENVVVRWPALHNRLVANPRLPLQLAVELTVGFVSKTLAEVQDRRTEFFQQFDHYLCNLSLELFGDAMLVWLLSPVAGGASLLPKHFLQIGKFTNTQRMAGFVYKGLQFGVVGIASSAIGQMATRGLVKARGGDTEELPEVWPNCLAWGGFLMLSSNTRYQLINGFEQRVLEKTLPRGALGAGLTLLVRFGNCYLGGLQWLPWARFLGVQ